MAHATLFEIREADGSTQTGWAVLCPAARYVGVLLLASARTVAPEIDDAGWSELSADDPAGMRPGPQPLDCAITRLLTISIGRPIVVHAIRAYASGPDDWSHAELNALLISHRWGPIVPPANPAR